MRRSFLGLTAAFFGCAALVATACGEDDPLIRPRLTDAGSEAAVSGEGGTGCGVAIPEAFAAPSFATNATVELALANSLGALDSAMSATEGSSTTTVAAADLNNLFNAGSPSLRTVATSYAQTTVDAYLVAYGATQGKTWQPSDVAGGTTTGGKYSALFYESPIGLDIRGAVNKSLLGGALFNHVLALVAAPLTDATVDSLLAAFGASTALANRTDVDAGVDGDRLIAQLASKRDDKSMPTGIYRNIRTALLTMKATVAAGDRCKTDQDAAIATYLREWEHATYASAIFSLNAAATAAADPTKGALALHSYADAVGLIQSFKGLPGNKKNIQDSQIDAILAKIGTDSPYKLVTDPGTRVPALQSAITDIALYETFDSASVDDYKKSF